MAKNSKELLEEIQSLSLENTRLQKKLLEAKELIDAMNTGNIYSLVIAHDKELKMYPEKTSDNYSRILIEKMHEGAVTLSQDGHIIFCNTFFAKMVNLPMQKVIGKLFLNFIDKSSKGTFKDYLKKGRMNALKEEIFIAASEGKKLPVLMTLNPLTLDDAFVFGIILTDLTVQIENQEQLKLRTEQLEQQNEKLESVNFQLSFQIEEKEKRGAKLIIAAKKMAIQNEEKEIRAAEFLIADKELTFQNEEKEKRADELILANKELAFQNEEKEKRAAELSIAQTVVKELEELNLHKENVLSTISHDLRGPLSGIIGMADFLHQDYESLDTQTIKMMIGNLYKASTEELNMLDYLVEWARIKYAADAFSPQELDLAHFVKKAFDRLNENAIQKNLHLYNQIEENTKVFMDGKMLLSILQNILSNSIKYTPEGGNIVVSAKKYDDQMIVEIKDSGIGMSKEIKEQLFTPQMVSLSKARKDNHSAGIGLLLVKGFLEKSGQQIWVESTVNEGSSFYFTLQLTIPS